MNDDASDLTAAVAGDQRAFARLYERHAAVVLSLCRRRSNFVEAEDAMQETFLRAYRRLHQLNHPDEFRAWLYAIARRVCSEQRRSTDRRDRHEANAAQRRADDPPETPTANSIVERIEQLELLDVAIDALPDNERLAIHLYYLDDDPVRAAADSLGLTRSGFYKLLTRARKHLAIAMKEAQPT